MTSTPLAETRREESSARIAAAFKGATVAIRRLRGRDTHRPGEPSLAQLQLLFGLAEHRELTTGELALAADLAPASATALLDNLEALGLVERTRSDRDRRVVTCSLTASGAELVHERRRQLERRWKTQLAGFTTGELDAAARVLEHIRTLYEELAAEHAARPAPPRPALDED